MEDLLDRTKGHRGQAKVRAALEIYDETAGLHALRYSRGGSWRSSRRPGCRLPSMNLFVEGFEIDAYWAEARFGVELDVYETHGSRLSFEEDRERDDELLLAGIETTRVTGPRLAREPGGGRRVGPPAPGAARFGAAGIRLGRGREDRIRS